MAGQQTAHVLDADVALEQGLTQVADRRGTRDRQPEQNALPGLGPQRPGQHDPGDDHTGHRRTDESLPRLPRGDGRGHLVPTAGEDTGRVTTDVAGHHRSQKGDDSPATIGGFGEQRGEASRKADVAGHEGGAGDVAEQTRGRPESTDQRRHADGAGESQQQAGGPIDVRDDRHGRRPGNQGKQGNPYLRQSDRADHLVGAQGHRDTDHPDKDYPQGEQRNEDDGTEKDADTDGGRQVAAGT